MDGWKGGGVGRLVPPPTHKQTTIHSHRVVCVFHMKRKGAKGKRTELKDRQVSLQSPINLYFLYLQLGNFLSSSFQSSELKPIPDPTMQVSIRIRWVQRRVWYGRHCVG